MREYITSRAFRPSIFRAYYANGADFLQRNCSGRVDRVFCGCASGRGHWRPPLLPLGSFLYEPGNHCVSADPLLCLLDRSSFIHVPCGIKHMNERLEFHPDERTIAKLHKHWIIFLRDTINTLALGIILLIPALYALKISAFQSASTNAGAIIYFGVLTWLLIVFLSLSVIWTNYYLDMWIVTDRRIINIDQIGLFNRQVATWRMERVQEITLRTKNIVQSLFNYGAIEIQTAGPTDEYAIVEGIPNPEHVRDMILTQVDAWSESSLHKHPVNQGGT